MDYRKLTDACVQWIRDWFDANGPKCKAVLGMSGGKDSTVAAALCTRALGADRVVGVAMPADGQGLNGADEICRHLGISYICVPIGRIEEAFREQGVCIPAGEFSLQSVQNIPPRIRMTVLYAVAQSVNGMVANTCNLSEDYIGYATLFGDAAGSFSPLRMLCAREVRGIGHELGLPAKWVDKTPDDGLPGSCPDEQKFGFSYDTLDRYIREGICDDPEVRAKIDTMHRRNIFKTEILHIPAFDPARARLDLRNAILITHGTDTMAWTLAALRYAVKDNTLNIALTGSQIKMPDGVGDYSDAYANISGSISFLSLLDPPQIFTVFNNGRDAFSDSLYKVDRWENNAFTGDRLGTLHWDEAQLSSGGDAQQERELERLYVITTGGTIESGYNSEGVLTPGHNRLQAYIQSRFEGHDTKVIFKPAFTIDSSDLTFDRVRAIIEKVRECFCEIDPESGVSVDLSFDSNVRIIFTDPFKRREHYLQEMEGASAVIIAGYGSGNINIDAPCGYSPLELIREKAATMPIVLTSQVALGPADFAYDNSWQAIKAGAISGVDMSIPEIQVRLAYIMGHMPQIEGFCSEHGVSPVRVVEQLFMSGVKFRTRKSREMYEALRGMSFCKEEILAGRTFAYSLARISSNL
ncbi:MAG: NAD(+) synthase [Bacteroidales bacterium]|nr:NAD(+) synthase [Bacteroidales bacterium]